MLIHPRTTIGRQAGMLDALKAAVVPLLQLALSGPPPRAASKPRTIAELEASLRHERERLLFEARRLRRFGEHKRAALNEEHASWFGGLIAELGRRERR